jgi:cytochrome oxidase Cu insertion factor (SCO1/SenC/PrrC family)
MHLIDALLTATDSQSTSVRVVATWVAATDRSRAAVRTTVHRDNSDVSLDMLNEGQVAPDFEVTAHDGSRVKLSDFSGKYVLLWFYPAADTPG